MNRLREFDLTANEKAYLTERANNGVCASANDHQCYLGMNFIIYFKKRMKFVNENMIKRFLASWVSLENLNLNCNFKTSLFRLKQIYLIYYIILHQ